MTHCISRAKAREAIEKVLSGLGHIRTAEVVDCLAAIDALPPFDGDLEAAEREQARQNKLLERSLNSRDGKDSGEFQWDVRAIIAAWLGVAASTILAHGIAVPEVTSKADRRVRQTPWTSNTFDQGYERNRDKDGHPCNKSFSPDERGIAVPEVDERDKRWAARVAAAQPREVSEAEMRAMEDEFSFQRHGGETPYRAVQAILQAAAKAREGKL